MGKDRVELTGHTQVDVEAIALSNSEVGITSRVSDILIRATSQNQRVKDMLSILDATDICDPKLGELPADSNEFSPAVIVGRVEDIAGRGAVIEVLKSAKDVTNRSEFLNGDKPEVLRKFRELIRDVRREQSHPDPDRISRQIDAGLISV